MTKSKEQRKACDLCYGKRIKCDAQKPRCSNCVVYASACTYVSASRKATSRKNKTGPGKDEATLQSRVESLEAELQLLADKVKLLARPPGAAPQGSAPDAEMEQVGPLGGRARHAARDLPPLQEVLPMVETYLATSNSVLPLFHPPTLLDMVKKWYWYPAGRDAKTWAAINVVLALAHRFSNADAANPNPNSNPNINPNPTRRTAEHVSNTQSVLTEVIMGDTDLVSVQVLLGLVMLFQGSQDIRPATILIATAIRLAHQLGLHTRRSSAQLERRLALQRDRVFWIAYILDRDISMRIRQTPVQHEAEIDLDLPEDEPGDQAGCVATADGLGRMNFFLARVQLARIQGRVHHCLFSVQAQHYSAEEKTQQVVAVGSMLDAWTASIPHGFRPDSPRLSEASLLGSGLSRPLCVLYSARLTCLCLINGAHPWNLVWMQGLQDYGTSATAGNAGEGTSSVPALPLAWHPLAWQALVDESRDFVRLFGSVPFKDASFLWMTLCAYVSGLLCLAANIICNPHHETAKKDLALADAALQLVDKLAGQASKEMLVKIRDTCAGLVSHARSIAAGEEGPHVPASTLWSTDHDVSSSVAESYREQALDDLPSAVGGSFDSSWNMLDGSTELESDTAIASYLE